MAMMLTNWIGPIVEAELEAAITSKMANIYTGSSISANSSQYRATYDVEQSCVKVNLAFSDDQAEQVQVLENLNHIHENVWRVSDGKTALRISLTHPAIEKFRNYESMSKMQKGVLLQLSKFSVTLPLFEENPKVKVDVHDFRVTVSVAQNIMGHPRDLDSRGGVQAVIQKIQSWNRKEYPSIKRELSAPPSAPPVQLNGLSRVTQPVAGKTAKGGVNLDRPTGIERYETKPRVKKSAVQEAVRLDPSITSEIRVADPHLRTEVSATNSRSGVSRTSSEASDKDMSSEEDTADKSNQNATRTIDIAHIIQPIEKAHANQTKPSLVPERMDISDWDNLPQLTRSMTIVPPNQAKLLSNAESWLPAAPGKTFPTPNIPIDIIKQIHGKLLASAPAPTSASVSASASAQVELPAPSASLTGDSEQLSDSESASSTVSGGPREEDESDNDESDLPMSWSATPQQPRAQMLSELPPNSSALSTGTTRLEEPQSSPIASSRLRKKLSIEATSLFGQNTGRDSDAEMEEEAPKPLNLPIKKPPVAPRLLTEERSVSADNEMDNVVVPSTSEAFSNSTAHTSFDRQTKRELLIDPTSVPPPKRVKSLGAVRYGFSQEPPVSQDPAIQAVHERRSFFNSKLQSPDDPASEENHAVAPAERVLAQFHAAYPEHKCDLRMFLGLCKMIDRLQREGRMLHKFLWDDFIVRYNADYRAHALRAIEAGEDAMPYASFYHNHIDEPKYMKLIMTPQQLQEILAAEVVVVDDE